MSLDNEMEFHPSDLEVHAASLIVPHITFCAVELEENEERVGNHWVLFLNTADKERSIRVDVLKREGTNVALIRFKDVNYRSSWSSVYLVKISARHGLTVREVIDFIKENGFGSYLMAPNGAGCRYWILCLVAALEGTGMIVDNDGDIQDLRDSLKKSYDQDGNPGSEDVPPAQGTFV